MTDRHRYPAAWENYSPHQKLKWRKENETNSTGFVGVNKAESGRFTSSIFDPSVGKKCHLGTFDTAKEAGDAFEEAHARIYGDPPDDEPDPDPEDLEGLHDVMTRWDNETEPPGPEFNEMFDREVRPLFNFDEETTP